MTDGLGRRGNILFLEYQNVCPSSELADLALASECVTKGEGETLACGRGARGSRERGGGGGEPIRMTGEKSLAPFILCGPGAFSDGAYSETSFTISVTVSKQEF